MKMSDNILERNTGLLKTAIRFYGRYNQLIVALEELSELQKEICKYRRGQENIDHIIEEMADVYIMLKQLKLIVGIEESDLEEEMEFKLSRLADRLSNGETE